MSNRFAGKVALITGGGSGIGRATAQAFAREGATVVLAGRSADSLNQTVKVVTAEGGLASAVVATNLTGLYLALKYEIAHMRGHGGGAIVNMASNIGAHGRRPGLGAYAATKAAVSALTRTVAREYIGENVRINAVSPGATDTAMSRRPGESDAERDARIAAAVPLGRVGTTEEVAAAVLWLASPEAAFAVGHDLVVDGGATA